MQRLFRRIWQWLKHFFGQFFASGSTQAPQRRKKRQQQEDTQPPLTDTDYEFLFMQLLDGVAHGWHEGRILKFFDQLGDRGKARHWVAWLERFGDKVLAANAPNYQLAVRMMRLGELAQSFPTITPIGQSAYRIGQELRDAGSAVWEYEGPDAEFVVPETSAVVEDAAAFLADELGESENTSQLDNGAATLTLDELFTRLQQDAGLAEQIAQQLGLESSDPQAILEMLVHQFQSIQQDLDQQKPPETVDEWFNRGLQQAGLGDLEGAIASWEQALELNPQLTQAWHNRGSALGELGRTEEAIASFDRALELNPDDYQVWNAKGNALYHLQQWEAAIACWDRVLALSPNYYQAWYNRGSALENWGRQEDAIASYTKALEIEPDFDLAQDKLRNLS
jgi:tetratricopeptide (TPR) repeat protein